MNHEKLTRRRMLQSAAAGAALGAWGFPVQPASAARAPADLTILEPVSGAVLNHRHGRQTSDGLTIRVVGQARRGDRVTVNQVACRVEGTRFEGEVVLRQPETDLLAVAEGAGPSREDRVRVVWDRYSEPRYRFSIDDNSFFLRDIAQKNYRSLFDCFYLKMLRDLHAKYGAKFSVNIFYTAADDAKVATGTDFKISQFPDRYKGQWRDNSHWLKLAFHAYANMPDRPYQDVPPERLVADLDLVAAEIRRFAGEESYAPPTVIHWGMTRRTALAPLFRRGVRALSGYFVNHGRGWDINYGWDDAHSEYLSRHNAWKDFESGIVFSRIGIVCNSVPLERIAAVLEPLAKDPNTAEIMDLFTHEQYFWPFYFHYIPDHARRVDRAIRWVTERGYQPVFFHEGLLGGRV
ncbi:MAG: hypothetical protein ABSF26_20460 [Thermoguttaceae bacterium]